VVASILPPLFYGEGQAVARLVSSVGVISLLTSQSRIPSERALRRRLRSPLLVSIATGRSRVDSFDRRSASVVNYRDSWAHPKTKDWPDIDAAYGSMKKVFAVFRQIEMPASGSAAVLQRP
jgi:hypothetical protein